MSIFASIALGGLLYWYVYAFLTVMEISKKNKIIWSTFTFVCVVIVMEIFFYVVGLRCGMMFNCYGSL